MARKPKTRSGKRSREGHRPGWWKSLDGGQRRRVMVGCGVTVLALSVLTAGAVTVTRLEARVERKLVDRFRSSLVFVDLPEDLEVLAERELYESVADLFERNWTDDALCREMAERLAAVGWIERVKFVRRSPDARFEVSCRYRRPSAMVQVGTSFFLVNAAGVNLPGEYAYDPAWRLIQGTTAPPPHPGEVWPGEDIQAGLALLGALAGKPYAEQITAVLVGNFGGRVDPRRSHIELATDRAGGRIHWGSAPGFELEENTSGQKLAILQENFRRTGRVDAHHAVIDVSTFPDRFTVPG